ncbi:MAG TPA: MraY family glycosyltransferase [Panacibacter sp.]|nr:MraY family glycosyltransferase [Panacibacter sp.]HNP45785.1 MraY family glycosyltransferase [Panacibacter sp.]
MNTEQLFAYLLPTVVTIIIVMLLLPLLIKLSPALKLVDIPNERKVHKTPIPAIGGMVIVVSVIITYFIVPSLHTLLTNSMAFAICLVLLMITGVVDDRLNISAALRFLIQIGCAVFVAANGIRLTSLHGILGLYEIPVAVQYMLTVTVITGVTNAFNLIDGIDGLAGSFSVINLTVLSIIAVLTGQEQWLALFLPLVAALLVFLKYNWRPAKVFMGDGGSLFFGFFTVTSGIMLIEKSFATNNSFSTTFMLVISAACIIPVVDTVRVFYQRMQKGRSPFSADKNHLHHWLIKHYMVHSQATRKLLRMQIMLIVLSIGASFFMNITVVIVSQALFVLLYTKLLKFNNLFFRWYRYIKTVESRA